MKTNDITKQTYNDRRVVRAFADYNKISELGHKQLDDFLQLIPEGGRILDLGCGPGWHAIVIAEKGYSVVGLDYSTEMIRVARNQAGSNLVTEWVAGDMLELEDLFEENSFEAAWARASLLHIKKEDIDRVLTGIRHVCVKGGVVMISLKQGEGMVRIKDEKFGLETEREFVLWEKDEFVKKATEFGMKLKSYNSFESSSIILGRRTKWHWMGFEIE